MDKKVLSNNRTSNNIKKNSVSKVAKKKESNVNINNKKNKKKTLRTLFVFFLLGIFSCLVYLAITMPYFNIQSITIEGNSKYTYDEIINKSGIQTGKNIFIQFFKGYKKNISDLSYIDSSKLSISFPNKLKIKVKERTSSYIVFDKEKNRFFKMDQNGYILEQSDINSKTKDELLVYGITFDDQVKFGQKINDTYLSKLEVYKKILGEFKKSGINGSITKVNFENSLTTITINDKLNVIFPNDNNLRYNMSFLVGIIQKLGADPVGTIDMTKTNPTFSSL